MKAGAGSASAKRSGSAKLRYLGSSGLRGPRQVGGLRLLQEGGLSFQGFLFMVIEIYGFLSTGNFLSGISMGFVFFSMAKCYDIWDGHGISMGSSWDLLMGKSVGIFHEKKSWCQIPGFRNDGSHRKTDIFLISKF